MEKKLNINIDFVTNIGQSPDVQERKQLDDVSEAPKFGHYAEKVFKNMSQKKRGSSKSKNEEACQELYNALASDEISDNQRQ